MSGCDNFIAQWFKQPTQETFAAATLKNRNLCLQGPDLIVFARETEEEEITRLGVYSIQANAVLNSCVLDSPAGTLMAPGDVAVSFYETPKLLDLATGKVLHRWPELSTGRPNRSIIYHLDRVPPIALDPLNRRFAVADSEAITVLQLG